MNKRLINFWLILVVALVAFGWMFAELFRVFFEVKSIYGFSAIPFDGVMQHKIGELLAGIPFVAILAFSNRWSTEKTFVFIGRMRIVMIAGGLLNALAWYSLREKVEAESFLRIWCLVIFVFGLFGFWVLSWIMNRTTKAG
jgi:hypothetical protein